MQVRVINGSSLESNGEVSIIPVFEGIETLSGQIGILDQTLQGEISQLMRLGEIKAKFKETTLLFSFGKLAVSKVLVLGMGKPEDINPERIRVAVSEACKYLAKKNVEVVNFLGWGHVLPEYSGQIAGQSVIEGAILGSYSFRAYVSDPEEKKVFKEFRIFEPDTALAVELEKGLVKGRITAESAVLARNLVNEPSNVVTPSYLAEFAIQLAAKNALEIKVLEREDMKTLGMGGLLGVSQGSQQPPKLIEIHYKGRDFKEIDVALIGKGITFDSGGISIKPSENMGDMKGDMAGAASVLGAINGIAQLKPRVNVSVFIPATENLPSGTAMKPGDIIKIMNGKTVEIISTDAEGRLILADALSYAKNMGARKMVDIATLTGACSVALGNVNTGAFSNDQPLVDWIIAAGSEAGEPMWQMPMNLEYKEQNKSNVADLKNTGGRYGGAITAAWFLREFVDDIPWVHLDIAGTFMLDKNRGYQLKGATGVPVRTLINLALNLEKA